MNFEQMTSDYFMKRITRTPGICGGDARIRDTRIAVWSIVEVVLPKDEDDFRLLLGAPVIRAMHTSDNFARYRELRARVAQILADYPELEEEDVSEALLYYCTHRDEINRNLAENAENDI